MAFPRFPSCLIFLYIKVLLLSFHSLSEFLRVLYYDLRALLMYLHISKPQETCFKSKTFQECCASPEFLAI